MPLDAAEPRSLVLDASVVIAWLIPEVLSGKAAHVMQGSFAWVAPRFMLAEFAGAVHRKVAIGELSVDIARDALAELSRAVRRGFISLAADEAYMEAALAMALKVAHPVGDCIYIAIAKQESHGLATADRKLGRLAQKLGVPVVMVARS